MTDAEDKSKPDTAGEPVQLYKRIQVFRSWQEAEDADVADMAQRTPLESLELANSIRQRAFPHLSDPYFFRTKRIHVS